MDPPLKISLAIAVAGGESVADWARTKEVPARTAYRWAATPEIRRTVQEIRRRSVDQAIGRLSRHATTAAEQIAKLAETAEAEAVRLAACRGLLADLVQVGQYADLANRLEAIETALDDRDATHERA